jgi:hypothetical protein
LSKQTNGFMERFKIVGEKILTAINDFEQHFRQRLDAVSPNTISAKLKAVSVAKRNSTT